MGIDYVIDHRCEPKDALGTDGIVAALKGLAHADAIRRSMAEKGDTRPAYEVTFKVRVVRAGIAQDEERTLQSLLVRGAALRAQAPFCSGCSGSPTGRPFGCVGYVPYPISRRAELWLMDRLPADLTSTAGQLLHRALADFDWGDYASSLRASPENRYFEQAEAPRHELGEGAAISGDQVFDMLFSWSSLTPSHCKMVALFFGVIPHHIERERLQSVTRDELLGWAASAPHPELNDPQIMRLDGLLRSIMVAAALDRPLLLNP